MRDEAMAFNYHGAQGYNFEVPFNLAKRNHILKLPQQICTSISHA